MLTEPWTVRVNRILSVGHRLTPNFDNYQKACQAHMSHELWFISQFLGRTREPLVEQIITGPFGQGGTDGDHFLYSYIDAEISDPRRPFVRPTHPRMMIDTRAASTA